MFFPSNIFNGFLQPVFLIMFLKYIFIFWNIYFFVKFWNIYIYIYYIFCVSSIPGDFQRVGGMEWPKYNPRVDTPIINHTCHNTCTYWVHTGTYWCVPFSALHTSMYSVHTSAYMYVPNTLLSYNQSRFQMRTVTSTRSQSLSKMMR